MLKRHKGFIALLFVGVILRVFFILWSVNFREHPDVLRYTDWARISFLYGFADTYKPDHLSFGTYPNNQPPMSVYILSSAYWVWVQMGKVLAHMGVAPGSNPWVNTVLLTLFLRIPSFVCDIAIGILIYISVLRFGKKERSAKLAAALFLFNPVVLYNSAIWGQMDSINNFFFLLGVYFLIIGKFIHASIGYAVSLLTKFSLLTMAPAMLLLTWLKSKKNILVVLKFVVVGIIVTLIASFPVNMSPWSWYGGFVTGNATGEMTNVTAFAFNFWWVIFRPTLLLGVVTDAFDVTNISLSHSPLVETTYGVVSLRIISLVVAVFSMGIVYWRWVTMQKKTIVTPVAVWQLIASIAIVSYVFLPQMHERYLYPAWAPIAMLVGFGIPIFWELLLLSIVNLVNLLIVWHPMPLPWWIYDLMRDTNIQWSVAVLTVIIGVWTTRKMLYKI